MEETREELIQQLINRDGDTYEVAAARVDADIRQREREARNG